MRRRDLITLLGGCALAWSGRASAADEVAVFYRNHPIIVYVGYPAGGGYDIYARLAARFIGRYIPGNPNVVVENMPGAGSLQAANFLYESAPKDGTALGVLNQDLALEEVLATPNIRYVAAKYTYIGRIASNVQLQVAWYSSNVNTIEDAMKREITAAGSGPIAPGEVFPRVLNNLVGTKFKVVSGYRGSSEGTLAMERGEVMSAEMSWTALKTGRPDWLRDKKVNILVQYAPERLPELKNIPTMIELGKTDEDRKVLRLYASGSAIGSTILAPPGIPPERAAALRAAFMAMVNDPAFLADVKKEALDLDPLSGEALRKIVGSASNVSPDVVARARDARH